MTFAEIGIWGTVRFGKKRIAPGLAVLNGMAAHTRQLLLTDVRFCYRVGSVHVCCLMSQFVVLSQTFCCHGANRKAVGILHRSQRLLIPQTRILYVVLHSLLQASVLNSLPTRTLYAVLNSMLSEFADDDIGDDDNDDSCFSSQCCTA